MVYAQEGKHGIEGSATLFYMVHCGKALYNNLLWRNWSEGALSKMVIIGNSFKGMEERWVQASQGRGLVPPTAFSSPCFLYSFFSIASVFCSFSRGSHQPPPAFSVPHPSSEKLCNFTVSNAGYLVLF